MEIPFKSYCWSFGTTSFRTKDFNRTIEVQLSLLDEFWSLCENNSEDWRSNNALQARYYDFMKGKGFVAGSAGNKPKDAREKTSGLVNIGLIRDDRRLTPAGYALLDISRTGDFEKDDFFQIPKDSYVYLKQLLKTFCSLDGESVRPFLVFVYVLSKVGSLSSDEFTYLLPLCTTRSHTMEILRGIELLRAGRTSVDEIILKRLLAMDNYKQALELFINGETGEELLCEIGLNRKSRNYDSAYYPLYKQLFSVYIERDMSALSRVYEATGAISIGAWWRKYLFNTTSIRAIERTPQKCVNTTAFDGVADEAEFKTAFFRLMHLFKAKATLCDYRDLNTRYIKTSDIVLFSDSTVKLDVVPKHFFASIADELFLQAFTPCELIYEDCPLESISHALVTNESAIVKSVKEELGINVVSLEQARTALEDERYSRFKRLIDTKFTDEKLLALLDMFERRNDKEIRTSVTDNADVPTIFEYILGIVWYKTSERQGRILDYMKLSLDADLLPVTHAAGGEADIVYEYNETEYYPKHSLLLEATLAESTNQRRMEMEPVSRHLGQHLIKHGNMKSYCVFATNHLDINVIADFRGRKNTPFYDTQDHSKSISGMKIIPLETGQLKSILSSGIKYKALYEAFEKAFNSTLPPHEWKAI